ncbi:MAG: hypothetical protein AABX10_03290 [Nanoarchaeota archaeon]
MANEKKMDQKAFNSIVKEVTAVGEMIRTHQDEKQSVMDNFMIEKKNYHAGRISKKALNSSASKVNKELYNMDLAIRKQILNLSKVATQAKSFATKQHPRSFKASITGIKTRSKK